MSALFLFWVLPFYNKRMLGLSLSLLGALSPEYLTPCSFSFFLTSFFLAHLKLMGNVLVLLRKRKNRRFGEIWCKKLSGWAMEFTGFQWPPAGPLWFSWVPGQSRVGFIVPSPPSSLLPSPIHTVVLRILLLFSSSNKKFSKLTSFTCDCSWHGLELPDHKTLSTELPLHWVLRCFTSDRAGLEKEVGISSSVLQAEAEIPALYSYRCPHTAVSCFRPPEFCSYPPLCWAFLACLSHFILFYPSWATFFILVLGVVYKAADTLPTQIQAVPCFFL